MIEKVEVYNSPGVGWSPLIQLLDLLLFKLENA